MSYDDITGSVLLYLGTPVALLFVCSHVYVHTSSAKCSTVVYAFGYYVVYPRSSVVTGGSFPAMTSYNSWCIVVFRVSL